MNYEEQVKKVYVRSRCVRGEFGYVILTTFNEGLSHEKPTEIEAWQSAYEKLLKDGKI